MIASRFGIIAIAMVAVALTASMSSGQAKGRSVKGTVTDSAGRPIVDAIIEAGKAGRTATDDSGSFTLRLPDNKEATLDVRRLGYAASSLKVGAGGDTSITVKLNASVQALAQMKIYGEMSNKLTQAGFYERLRDAKYGAGGGTFITPELLDLRKPAKITQVLEGIPGVRVRNYMKIGGVPLGTTNGQCLLTTYLNGVRTALFRDSATVQSGSNFQDNIHKISRNEGPPLDPDSDGMDKFLNPLDVLGMEVYPTPGSVPMRYPSNSGACGVLLIWTK